MARRSPGRVQMKTSTTGNGPYTLANPSPALAGKRTIAEALADGSLVNGDEILYAIVDATAAGNARQLEVGRGTINTATLVLTVVQVYEKSALLTSGGGWGAGTRDVLISPPGAWNTAFIDLANVFTATQAIDGVSPTLQFTSSSVIRLRELYSSNTGFRQYFNSSSVIRASQDLSDSFANLNHYNSSGVLDGSLEVGAAALNFTEGGLAKKVVRFVGGGVVKVPFYMATAPLGWTKDTSQNDKAMRVVSGGTGGTSGGSRALSSSVVGGTSLSIAQLAAHTHNVASFPITVQPLVGEGFVTVNYIGAGGTQVDATSVVGSSTSHDHALALAYVDVIICSLD
jgi:hypothetical protein